MSSDEPKEGDPGSGSNERAASSRPPIIEGKAETVADTTAEEPASKPAGSAEPPSDQAPKPEPAQKKSGGGGFLTGLIGGLVAVGIAFAGLHFSGMAPRLLGVQAPQQDTAVADLQSKLAETESGLGALRREVGKLSDDVETQGSGGAADVDQLKSDIGGLKGDVGDLKSRTASLESGPDASGEIGALKDKVATLETALDGLKSEIATLKGDVAPKSVVAEVGQQAAQVTALETAVGALGPSVRNLSQRVQKLEETEDDPTAAERAALGLAVANLARESATAGGFEPELDAVKAFLPNASEVTALEGPAKAGVPTEDELAEEFPALVQKILGAERDADKGAGWWGDLVSGAQSVVTVRRTDATEGDTTDAVLARTEEQLKDGDLAGAVSAIGALKGAAASAAAPWVTQANERIETDRLVRQLTAKVAEAIAEARATPASAPPAAGSGAPAKPAATTPAAAKPAPAPPADAEPADTAPAAPAETSGDAIAPAAGSQAPSSDEEAATP